MQRRSMLLPLIILFAIIVGGNFVAATLILSHAPQFLQDSNWFLIAWTIFFLFQIAAPGIQISSRGGKPQTAWIDRLHWWAYAALGIMSTTLVVAISLELVGSIVDFIFGQKYTSQIDTVWFALMVLVVGVTAVAGMIQATVGPQVKTIEVFLERLPAAFEGYRIVQISDLHVSSLIGKRYTQLVVNLVNSLHADLVAMTGDFVDGTVNSLQYRVAPLGNLQSVDGRFFITGNHEYYYDAQSWVNEHRRLGATVLLNEHRVIERHGSKLVIAGVTDRSGGGFIQGHAQDIDASLKNAPAEALKILLAHQPGCYEEAEAKGIDLQLSGHTHGGQFFPWQFVVKMVHRYSRGLYRHGRMWIYVNPGTGFWGPPLRASVPPEITLIILKQTP